MVLRNKSADTIKHIEYKETANTLSTYACAAKWASA